MGGNKRKVWFISDTHFGHDKLRSKCRPEFSSIEEMDETIIQNWNLLVRPQDLVYHLGDFAWKVSDAARVRQRLNGFIDLMIGNHDPAMTYAKMGLFRRMSIWKIFDEHGFTATHIPMRREQLRYSTLNLHGHVHGNRSGLESFHRDISVESIGYKPVPLDEVVSWAEALR